SSILLRQRLRGMLLLPWCALTACRRSLTLPLLVAVAVVSAVDPALLTFRQVAVVGGIVVGAHLLIIVLLLVARRRFAALPFVPLYVVFRIFKLYVAFESLLTLELRQPMPVAEPVSSLRAAAALLAVQAASSSSSAPRRSSAQSAS